MVLSKQVADIIVGEISKVIVQNINVIDTDGIIISSTDKSREGTFHEGGKRIVEEHLSELIVSLEDELMGTRCGTNLPIEFDGEIVGVIGITGDSEEVKNYGKIIKKMTEILIVDNFNTMQRIIMQKAKDRFLEEWVSGQTEIMAEEFQERGRYLSIDTTRDYCSIVVMARDKEGNPLDDNISTEISRQIRHSMNMYKNVHVFRTATNQVIIFDKTGYNKDEVLNIFSQIRKKTLLMFDCQIAVSVGTFGGLPLHKNYHLAKNLAGLSFKLDEIVCYDDHVAYRIFSEISENTKEDVLYEVFGDMECETYTGFLNVVKALYECDGSIDKASKKLFIHKNTLQYKLAKIKQLTGYDPKSYENCPLFSMLIDHVLSK